MAIGEGLLFRAAVREVLTNGKARWSLRERRILGRFLDDKPELAEIAAAEFAPEIGDEPPREPAPPVRGTPILDKLGAWMKWVIDNQERVLSFIQALITMIVAVFV